MCEVCGWWMNVLEFIWVVHLSFVTKLNPSIKFGVFYLFLEEEYSWTSPKIRLSYFYFLFYSVIFIFNSALRVLFGNLFSLKLSLHGFHIYLSVYLSILRRSGRNVFFFTTTTHITWQKNTMLPLFCLIALCWWCDVLMSLYVMSSVKLSLAGSSSLAEIIKFNSYYYSYLYK